MGSAQQLAALLKISPSTELEYVLGRAYLEKNGSFLVLCVFNQFETLHSHKFRLTISNSCPTITAPKEAAAQFSAVVSLESGHWPALSNLASALFSDKDLAGALGAVQEAIEVVQGSEIAVPPIEPDEVARLLADLFLQKGAILLEIPDARCAGGSCREHAAQAFRQSQLLYPSNSGEGLREDWGVCSVYTWYADCLDKFVLGSRYGRNTVSSSYG